jgi:hypothetical protein
MLSHRSRPPASLRLAVICGCLITFGCAGSPDDPGRVKPVSGSSTAAEVTPGQSGQGYVTGRQYPCGDPATLAEASENHDFTLYVPDHELASEATLTGVSDCPETVILYFASGVKTLIEPWLSATPPDPKEYWQGLADQEIPGTASVSVVRGVPALVIDVAAKPDWATVYLGGVSFFEEGLHIDVVGNGAIGATDLISVAETLEPVEAVPTPSGSP